MAGNISSPQAFNCPSCGASIVVRALGQTVSIACGSCGSIINGTQNSVILSRAAKTLKIVPTLELGQRGRLHGELWEVIGYMQRCDHSGEYKWMEYLLFNPRKGFRWLTEFDGHWNYVFTTKTTPIKYGRETTGKSAAYMGKTYALFHQGLAKVTHVVGEFYWRVKVGESVHVEDYILPPEILSSEKSKDEVIWSVGLYTPAEQIREAFQVKKPMPMQSGVAPNQTPKASIRSFAIAWVILVVIACMIQTAGLFLANNEVVYSDRLSFLADDPIKIKTSPQFALKHGMANVEFRLTAPVDNNWFEVKADLVNDENGETHEFELGVEYYSGYDSDGSWTEGSQSTTKALSSIPPGLYHLNIEEASGSPSLDYTFEVRRDVVRFSNFLWLLLLLSIFPTVAWLRRYSFERSRWSTSDFSPYWTLSDLVGEDDDD